MPMPSWKLLRLSCAAAMLSPFFPTGASAASTRSCHANWSSCGARLLHDRHVTYLHGSPVYGGCHSGGGPDRLSVDSHHWQNQPSLLGGHEDYACNGVAYRNKNPHPGTGELRPVR